MLFIDDSKTSPLVTFAPAPFPPLRRGEGRVRVMFLEIVMQDLGKGYLHSVHFASPFLSDCPRRDIDPLPGLVLLSSARALL